MTNYLLSKSVISISIYVAYKKANSSKTQEQKKL